MLSLPSGYQNFMSTTNNNDIYFLSTPHCLTLICISNFHPDNWSQTSFCRLPYGKEQLNTNQKKLSLFNHILNDIELPSLDEQEGDSL